MTENGNGKAVTQLSDDLIARARAIASRSDELLELLEDARQRLLDSEPGKEKGRRPGPKGRFKPESNSKPKAAPKAKAKSENGISDGLRLLTSQMAADGADRQEIAKCLREDFEIENPEPILKGMGL